MSGPDDTCDTLYAVGELLDREVALDELLRTMIRCITRTLGADRGTLFLVDRSSGELFTKVADLPELDEIRLELGRGVAGHVASSGEIVNVPTARTDPRFYAGVDDRTGYETRSILAVPVRDTHGRLLGVIQLLNKDTGAFTRDDEIQLGALAAQAGAAIEATSLYAVLLRESAEARPPQPVAGRFNRILGESPGMREAYRITSRASESEATVLVRGETGTGKELFARAVHVNSRRRSGPFVKVDCAALPGNLVENELFGHERGAYTGADRTAGGKVDSARGGTLFLDEIGELPPPSQAKLLRLLQNREYHRLGGRHTMHLDARVVAATSRDLEAMVEDGRFRADLYYRVKVVEIALPPLRARGPEDVERLARHFLATAARKHGRPERVLSEAAWARLLAHDFPGNVRELEHCIESAVVIAEGRVIEPEDLPLPTRRVQPGTPAPLSTRRGPAGAEAPVGAGSIAPEVAQPPGRVPEPVRGAAEPAAPDAGATEQQPPEVQTLAEIEREHILRVLAQVEGNRSKAARLLGIGRNTLARKLRGYGVDE